MALIGAFNILAGLIAVIRNRVAYVDAGQLLVVDVTGWGLLAMAFGLLLVAVGLGLLSGSPAARTAAVVLVVVHALAQVAELPAYPVWSLLMIALDVVVLYALTVRWSDATPDPHAGTGPGPAVTPAAPTRAP
jgi:hypothetical protein